ncbi:F0F1 ATP synthase subunit B' [Methylobacterium sp. WL30]|uniref:F0F1 ATP synthase subunit B family protein n=1 Tax=Methylobacterium sp. WL30 TaxID=2603895 RepID=UPI001FED5626|nr:F0F1 ATP synthase subunit B' [Methylobacterium sp. WL30]
MVPAGAAEPARAAAFPPFETHTFLAQLIWLALAFGLLYWLMANIALPRIQGILHDRSARLAADLDQAQAMKTEPAAAAETKRKALEAELNQKIAASEATIQSRTQEAMGNVRAIASETASAIVERLTGQAPDQASLDRALDSTATAH